mmetsp:Transcript_58474/g.163048  ORF Transcript_58474/g.163048 Transcript_58474/m.163048 type:complete len:434 (-) Transcript_58474:137-1438(-)
MDMLSGSVKVWYEDKNFGFVTPDDGGEDVFVHRNVLTDGDYLEAGAVVIYEASRDPARNRLMATRCAGAVKRPATVDSGELGRQAEKEQPATFQAKPPDTNYHEYMTGTGGFLGSDRSAGVVKVWLEEKGFGFISPESGGQDVFVHRSQLTDGQMLQVGSRVSYESVYEPLKGKTTARNVMGAAVKGSGKGGATIADYSTMGGAAGATNSGAWGDGSWGGSGCGSAWSEGGKGGHAALFVAGIPGGTSEDMVKQIFGAYGTVLSVKVLPSNGKPDLAAIVRMQDKAMTAWLVEHLNGNIPMGMNTPVSVKYAQPSGKSGDKGSGYACGKGSTIPAPASVAAAPVATGGRYSLYGTSAGTSGGGGQAFGGGCGVAAGGVATGLEALAAAASAKQHSTDATQAAIELADLLKRGGLDAVTLVDAASLLAMHQGSV